MAPPIPITIITGFLGSGKTTLILNLIPQLPANYKVALIKNEFGDVAVDSALAAAQSITGVKELLNGCICCNLVGSLADALTALREEYSPDRIIIETSGSAFPATLALEINRIARANGGMYALDGVVSVVDVENWKGYEDTSVTAKLQAQYTDLLVLNKWEEVEERVYEDCIDRILDLELDIPTPRVKSDRGRVERDVLLGLDAKLASADEIAGVSGQHIHEHDDEHEHEHEHGHGHDHDDSHSQEVEVLAVTLRSGVQGNAVDLEKLEHLLTSAPKDEVYRIKGIVYASEAPCSSTGDFAEAPLEKGVPGRYILNWAFGRWTFTAVAAEGNKAADELLHLTVVTPGYEANKWKRRIESGDYVSAVQNSEKAHLRVTRVL
jgi:G3E family GTPase